jgi:hypothetical protein
MPQKPPLRPEEVRRIDPFDAVLVDDRLPERFRQKRYPQMVEQIADRRRRSRAQRERAKRRKASK